MRPIVACRSRLVGRRQRPVPASGGKGLRRRWAIGRASGAVEPGKQWEDISLRCLAILLGFSLLDFLLLNSRFSDCFRILKPGYFLIWSLKSSGTKRGAIIPIMTIAVVPQRNNCSRIDGIFAQLTLVRTQECQNKNFVKIIAPSAKETAKEMRCTFRNDHGGEASLVCKESNESSDHTRP